MKNHQEIFIKCDCSCSMLEFSKLFCDDNTLCASIWHHWYEHKIHGLFERLRWCWNILFTGKPWGDEVIISKEKAIMLADFIYCIYKEHDNKTGYSSERLGRKV